MARASLGASSWAVLASVQGLAGLVEGPGIKAAQFDHRLPVLGILRDELLVSVSRLVHFATQFVNGGQAIQRHRVAGIVVQSFFQKLDCGGSGRCGIDGQQGQALAGLILSGKISVGGQGLLKMDHAPGPPPPSCNKSCPDAFAPRRCWALFPRLSCNNPRARGYSPCL